MGWGSPDVLPRLPAPRVIRRALFKTNVACRSSGAMGGVEEFKFFDEEGVQNDLRLRITPVATFAIRPLP